MSRDKYDELYGQYMGLQRLLAQLVEQTADGEASVRIHDDPDFPRLAYICAQKGPYYTDLSVVKVPG